MGIGKAEISSNYRQLQDRICKAVQEVDGQAVFISDQWDRPQGGGGNSRILTNGAKLEKAGVNFSEVEGKMTAAMRSNLNAKSDRFFATGISIVMHPINPFCPIIHMNIRYFEMDDGTFWFGGGMDLTPHFIDLEQAQYFHEKLKALCDRFDSEYYPRFKVWADDYFYLPHRKETRGVGGIFYDHLVPSSAHSKADLFEFSTSLGELFPGLYSHLLMANFDTPYNAENLEWRDVRRGRYVEFNLIHDRGTRFGLQSDGRTESILMSLPAQAKWFYNHQVNEGSPEALTLGHLKKGIDWINH